MRLLSIYYFLKQLLNIVITLTCHFFLVAFIIILVYSISQTTGSHTHGIGGWTYCLSVREFKVSQKKDFQRLGLYLLRRSFC